MNNLDPMHLQTLRLPQLWDLFREHVGESTRCPNKTFLIRKITEATQEAEPSPEVAPAWSLDSEELAGLDSAIPTALPPDDGEDEDEDEPSDEVGSGEVKLTALSVGQLRERYLEVIGRPTRSHDKRYLVWKLREAAKGRVRIGASRRRDEKVPQKVLPLRLPVPHVEALDGAWRRSEHANRTDFMRGALAHYLRHLGEPETAELFVEEASS